MLILFILGTSLDLKISKALVIEKEGSYFTKNYFSEFIGAISLFPVYLADVFFVGVIAFCVKDKSYKIVCWIIAICVQLLIGFYASFELVGNISALFDFEFSSRNLVILCCTLCAVIYILITVLILNFWGEKRTNSWIKFAIVFVISTLLTYLITQFLKSFYSRPRYKLIVLVKDYSLYKPWYKISFFKKLPSKYVYLGAQSDAYKSFPSGHVSFTSALLLFCVRAENVGDRKKKKILFVVPCVYLLIVAITRILCGAHYLTDVISGVVIAHLINLAVYKHVYKRNKSK